MLINISDRLDNRFANENPEIINTYGQGGVASISGLYESTASPEKIKDYLDARITSIMDGNDSGAYVMVQADRPNTDIIVDAVKDMGMPLLMMHEKTETDEDGYKAKSVDVYRVGDTGDFHELSTRVTTDDRSRVINEYVEYPGSYVKETALLYDGEGRVSDRYIDTETIDGKSSVHEVLNYDKAVKDRYGDIKGTVATEIYARSSDDSETLTGYREQDYVDYLKGAVERREYDTDKVITHRVETQYAKIYEFGKTGQYGGHIEHYYRDGVEVRSAEWRSDEGGYENTSLYKETELKYDNGIDSPPTGREEMIYGREGDDPVIRAEVQYESFRQDKELVTIYRGEEIIEKATIYKEDNRIIVYKEETPYQSAEIVHYNRGTVELTADGIKVTRELKNPVFIGAGRDFYTISPADKITADSPRQEVVLEKIPFPENVAAFAEKAEIPQAFKATNSDIESIPGYKPNRFDESVINTKYTQFGPTYTIYELNRYNQVIGITEMSRDNDAVIKSEKWDVDYEGAVHYYEMETGVKDNPYRVNTEIMVVVDYRNDFIKISEYTYESGERREAKHAIYDYDGNVYRDENGNPSKVVDVDNIKTIGMDTLERYGINNESTVTVISKESIPENTDRVTNIEGNDLDRHLYGNEIYYKVETPGEGTIYIIDNGNDDNDEYIVLNENGCVLEACDYMSGNKDMFMENTYEDGKIVRSDYRDESIGYGVKGEIEYEYKQNGSGEEVRIAKTTEEGFSSGGNGSDRWTTTHAEENGSIINTTKVNGYYEDNPEGYSVFIYVDTEIKRNEDSGEITVVIKDTGPPVEEDADYPGYPAAKTEGSPFAETYVFNNENKDLSVNIFAASIEDIVRGSGGERVEPDSHVINIDIELPGGRAARCDCNVTDNTITITTNHEYGAAYTLEQKYDNSGLLGYTIKDSDGNTVSAAQVERQYDGDTVTGTTVYSSDDYGGIFRLDRYDGNGEPVYQAEYDIRRAGATFELPDSYADFFKAAEAGEYGSALPVDTKPGETMYEQLTGSDVTSAPRIAVNTERGATGDIRESTLSISGLYNEANVDIRLPDGNIEITLEAEENDKDAVTAEEGMSDTAASAVDIDEYSYSGVGGGV